MTRIRFHLPDDAMTYDAKFQHCARAVEHLRRIHNVKGKACRDKEITVDEFRKWQSEWHAPREAAVMDARQAIAKEIKAEARTLSGRDLAESVDVSAAFEPVGSWLGLSICYEPTGS
ncbi:MAG: hypothetical protein U9Q07_12295, partial [Planctomycetota bacterium]|nr:hypothetical protein [Planctomycetota bacterium]